MNNCGRVLLAALCITLQMPCLAQTSSTGSSSSSSSFTGYGGASSNSFSPKYKERLANFSKQIETAIGKGWLTPAEAEMFRNQVFMLTNLEAEVAKKGYQKDELDDMEKSFNELNVRLSQAMSKGTPPPVTTDSGTGSGAASDKPAVAPAVKPVAKVPAKTATAAPKKTAASKNSVASKKTTTKTVKKAAVKKVATKKTATKKKTAVKAKKH